MTFMPRRVVPEATLVSCDLGMWVQIVTKEVPYRVEVPVAVTQNVPYEVIKEVPVERVRNSRLTPDPKLTHMLEPEACEGACLLGETLARQTGRCVLGVVIRGMLHPAVGCDLLHALARWWSKRSLSMSTRSVLPLRTMR